MENMSMPNNAGCRGAMVIHLYTAEKYHGGATFDATSNGSAIGPMVGGKIVTIFTIKMRRPMAMSPTFIAWSG